jgi:hypothetical protein
MMKGKQCGELCQIEFRGRKKSEDIANGFCQASISSHVKYRKWKRRCLKSFNHEGNRKRGDGMRSIGQLIVLPVNTSFLKRCVRDCRKRWSVPAGERGNVPLANPSWALSRE